MGAGRRRLPPGGEVLAQVVDALLEASIAGSFSRIGYLVRRAAEGWGPPPRVDGRVVVVAGASSGIGRAAALALGQLGAEVWATERDPVRTEGAQRAVRSLGGRAQAALLDVTEMTPEQYDGPRAYARAKRAQVVMAHEWWRRWSAWGVASYSMHPGWVDTPGLASGLPSFARLTRSARLLRTPAEGADTAVWLAAGGARQAGPAGLSGPAEDGFWHDRHPRSEHYFPWTRPQVTPEVQGRELWEWCAARTGLGEEP